MFDKRRNLEQKRAENQNFDTWKGNVLELKVTDGDGLLSVDEPSQRRQEMRRSVRDFFVTEVVVVVVINALCKLSELLYLLFWIIESTT